MKRLVPLLRLTLAALASAPAAGAVQEQTAGSTPPAQAAPAKPAPSAPIPSPTPLPELHGTVLGPDGKPLEKALVVAGAGTRGEEGKPRVARTGADGAFRMSLPPEAHYTVRVEAEGLAGRTFDRVEAGRPLTFRLEKGGVIRGIVRDGSTGRPLSGARVEASVLGPNGPRVPDEPMLGPLVATTDGQGRYTLARIGAGQHVVAARARGFSRAEREAVVAGGMADFHLFPGGSVAGVVRGPDGEPLPGALVQAEPDTPWEGVASRPEPADDRGRFEIVGLRPGTYSIVGRHRDHAPAVQTGIVVESEAAVPLDLRLGPGRAIVGRLVDRQGRTRAGSVRVQELDGAHPPNSLHGELRAEAGDDGVFRLSRVPAGAHTLLVEARGHAGQPLQVAVGSETLDLGDVLLQSGLSISGRVLDTQGRPLAEARLLASRRSADSDGSHAEASAAADGSFVLDGLRPGEYHLAVRTPGYAHVEETVEAGTDNLVFRLSAGGGLTGLVVDSEARAVTGFRVSLDSPEGRRVWRREQVTSEDGRFTITELESGEYVVSISAAQAATATVSAEVAAGAVRDLGRIRLGAGGVVRGLVADGVGNPVPGAVVTVQGMGRSLGWASRPQGATDAAGRFEVRGAPAGTVSVAATHPLFAPGHVKDVEVDPARGPAEVRVVLSRGGRVEGTARTRDGAPLVESRIEVRDADFAMRYALPPSGAVRDDGTYAVDHVAPGRVRVTLMTRRGNSYLGTLSREVEVHEGQPVRVDFVRRDIAVSGRITRSGAPAGSVRIQLQCGEHSMMFFAAPTPASPPGGGPERYRATTNADGSYEMLVDEPGPCAAEIDAATQGQGVSRRPVEIPDADAVTIDLELTGVPLAGVVVDDSDQPLPRIQVMAARKGGARGVAPLTASGRTGPDGRFTLDVQPGDYVVRAWADDRGAGRAEEEVSLTETGAPEVRLVLARGLTTAGRVIEAGGRGVGGIIVSATPQDGSGRGRAMAITLADGSFRLTNLEGSTYNLAGRSQGGLVAVRSGVPAGAADVVLTLKRGTRLLIHVRGPDGAPVEGAGTMIEVVDGQPYGGLAGSRTGTDGTTELFAPAGAVELRVRKERLGGRTTLNVPEGPGERTVRVTLEEEQEE